MSEDLTIGEAVKAVDLSVDAVRFYERQGIMAPPPRMAGGRRAYGPQQMVELTFIARGRAVRMPLSEIGRYLSLARQGEATLPERMRIITVQRQLATAHAGARDRLCRRADVRSSRGQPPPTSSTSSPPYRPMRSSGCGRCLRP